MHLCNLGEADLAAICLQAGKLISPPNCAGSPGGGVGSAAAGRPVTAARNHPRGDDLFSWLMG
ncbi:hypothetical protein BDA96_08G153500 [Sorghum bicolor]|uniref:Uncharacterized protein n=1 Tax=Sorghum bicolor TaxID=4558 RepID=A0A921QGC1_SORBI|nr:hypothetical protein BDA96_08G153500 [Sorghum bicolor]